MSHDKLGNISPRKLSKQDKIDMFANIKQS